MHLIKAFAALACFSVLTMAQTAAAKPMTIIYIPLDNRPVNTTYVEQTLAGAGCKIILPPEKFIASYIENRELLKLSNRKKFHFFAIGKDDNAKLCHTHMEARKLSMLTFNFPREHFQIIDGVDQLGLLLAARAYNGWNTADNTIGYAIAQGIFAEATPAPLLNKIIRQRVIDDWFYQSNARNKLTQRFDKITREDLKYSLGKLNKQTAKDALETCYQLSEKYDFTKNSKYTLAFPWDRLFEVDIYVKK